MQQSFSRSSLVPSGFLSEVLTKMVIEPLSRSALAEVSVRVRRAARFPGGCTWPLLLPLSGRIVQLVVIARRFRCDAVLQTSDLYRALRRRRIGSMYGRGKIDLLQARLIGAE